MTALTWNDAGERIFELGCDRGVFYPPTGPGVPWNGLLGVNQTPPGGSAQPYYMDGVKYYNRATAEDHSATLEALTYPDEFAEFDGSPEENGLTFGHQKRKSFDLSYRTLVANDLEGDAYAFKTHFVYNALAAPSAKNHRSIGSSVEPMNMSWDLSTTPIALPGRRPTSYFSIDSRKISARLMAVLDSILYGTEDSAPRLPRPAELVALLGNTVYELVPNHISGLWGLSSNGQLDVVGTDVDGLFTIPPTSRLVEVSDGLYSFDAPESTNRFSSVFKRSF